ncbi:MAG: ATP-dependent Clp protease ATP-binding subunit, partial [Anaerolineales bacterium]|nr:ATP-dependent Clp protease ATP-binding subunit [Anaerolineales bacterium]
IKRQPNIGFAFQQDSATAEAAEHSEMQKKLMEELKRAFRPEFINRVDSVIVFRQLAKEHIRHIVDIALNELNERLEEYELTVQATDEAKDWLAKEGFDQEYGARPLRRTIQAEVEDRLSDAMLSGKFEPGAVVLVDIEADAIVLRDELLTTAVITDTEEAVPAA